MEEEKKIIVEKSSSDKRSNDFGTIEVVVLLLITCISSVWVGAFLGSRALSPTRLTSKFPDEMHEFITNYNYIIDNYIDDVNKEDLIKGAIKGMIESLGDKYTSFLDYENGETFNIQLEGRFEGVGIEIVNTLKGNIIVTRVFEGSSADKAGIKSMDIIRKIDDIDLIDKESVDFTDLVKSKKGEFTIVVDRDGELLSKTVKKGNVEIPSVHSEVYNKEETKVGYIKVDLFAANTYTQFKDKLEKLEKDGIDSLIIDVRDNSGGHLSVVKNMISLFLDASNVIYQTETKKVIEKFYSTGSVTKKYPIVLLSNENSASASEVMIGALRDRYKAKVVGVTSFGKGTVQELNEISSQDQYKITTKNWLTPKGAKVDGLGLVPDYVIEQDEEYYMNPNAENDIQLKKALDVIVGL